MIRQEKIVLGISIGDLNGIGPEVMLKSIDKELFQNCLVIVYANSQDLLKMAKRETIEIEINSILNEKDALPNCVNVINCWEAPFHFNIGEEKKEAGILAIASLNTATKALKNDAIDFLVTAPINKRNIQSEQFKFPGHTDYIAQELEGEALMFMVHDDIKVGLLTDHVALKDVCRHITPDRIRTKALIIKESLKVDFGIENPKVAVLGINPHVGDDGVIGKEDQLVLIPTIKAINAEEEFLYGPFPADSFFGSQLYKDYDAVLASYHDQGLIPFKTLSFGKGVNFTAGLSKVRTSPDHGTAYGIAGKKMANPSSFKEALKTGVAICLNRKKI